MRQICPDWTIANMILQGYSEDGVTGRVGYDDRSATWYVDLDDAEYEQYMANLHRKNREIIDGFGYMDWHGATNVQGSAVSPPRDNEDRLAIYLVDCDCKASRGFKANAGLNDLLDRKRQCLFIGSTCNLCGKKSMVVITWEDVKPQKKGGENGTV